MMARRQGRRPGRAITDPLPPLLEGHHDGRRPRRRRHLLPCYATGRHRESGFYAWTIANVKKGAPRGWAAVVFMYFYNVRS